MRTVPATMAGPLAALAATFEHEVQTIRGLGGAVEVVFPDAEAAAAMGINLMDASMVVPAAEAGERQGKLVADRLAAFWRD